MDKLLAIIIGSRPQYIKLAPFLFYLKKTKISYFTIDTNQHYDNELSKTLIKELQIDKFSYNLNVKEKYHGKMTANMMIKIEKILIRKKPKMVVVFGDTNSTLASSLVAAKLRIPIAHIESGMRSYNNIPEEINRKITDKLSTLKFCSTKNALENLNKEGLKMNSFFCGDISRDNFKIYSKKINQNKILDKYNLKEKNYSFLTIHREDSVNSKNAIISRLNYVNKISKNLVIFPIHPKTKKMIKKYKVQIDKFKKIKVVTPLSYFETLTMLKKCDLVFTDSGGVQKDSFFLEKHCIILRSETEWTEIIETGFGMLWKKNIKFKKKKKKYLLGTGIISKKIINKIECFLKK